MNLTVIHKYIIPLNDGILIVKIPKDFRYCEMNAQGDNICIWALVDPESELKEHFFRIYGTGHTIPDAHKMIFYKTIHMPNGLVWHLFELPND